MARFRFAGVYLARKDDKLVGVPYADISIYLAGTDTPAVVYTSETGSYYVSSAPQLSTNENGEFEFYVDDTDYDYTQKFKIVCSKPGYKTKTWDYITIFPYAGFDAHSIRDINVVGLEGTIAAHDLLKYQGTQFVPENINEILKSYYSLSPGDVLCYDGTNLAPKKAGDWQVIGEINVTSDTTYVEFTGLDINQDEEYELIILAKNPTADGCHYDLFINGDTTGTNYYSQLLRGYGNNVTAARFNEPTISYMNANHTNFIKVKIGLDPDGYMRFISHEAPNPPTDNLVETDLRHGMKINTVTNITSIRIQAGATNAIGADSKFILCRIKRGD